MIRARLRRSRRLLLGIVLLGIGALALANGTIGARFSLWQHEWQWRARAIPQYRYVVRTGCHCPIERARPVVIDIRAGEPPTLRYDGTGDPAPAELFARYAPMEQMFALVHAALAAGAAQVIVRYDPSYSYPATIVVDYDGGAEEDEITYTIERFDVVP
jgi:hypothetical protein